MSAFEQFPTDLSICKPQYITNNIIVGDGEIVAIPTAHGFEYALPGGERTTDVVRAVNAAVELDRLFKAYKSKYNRRIMLL